MEKTTINIALDTSFIESQNYLAGSKIVQLGRLSANGSVSLFITDVVEREVISRFKKRLLESADKYRSSKKSLETTSSILRNFPTLESIFGLPEFDSQKLILEFEEKFRRWIKLNYVSIIQTRHIKVEEILDDYFKGRPPFHSEKKKNEFPDAISLKAIQDHFTVEEVVFLTHDKDFSGLENTNVKVEQDVAKFLDELIRHRLLHGSINEQTLIKQIEEYFEINRRAFTRQVKTALIDAIKTEVEWMYLVDHFHILTVAGLEIDFRQFSRLTFVRLEQNLAAIETVVSYSIEMDILVEDVTTQIYDTKTHLYRNGEQRVLSVQGNLTSNLSLEAEYTNLDDVILNIDFHLAAINDGEETGIFDLIKAQAKSLK